MAQTPLTSSDIISLQDEAADNVRTQLNLSLLRRPRILWGVSLGQSPNQERARISFHSITTKTACKAAIRCRTELHRHLSCWNRLHFTTRDFCAVTVTATGLSIPLPKSRTHLCPFKPKQERRKNTNQEQFGLTGTHKHPFVQAPITSSCSRLSSQGLSSTKHTPSRQPVPRLRLES